MGAWLNDHIQLCAQALCLEEMMHVTIPLGYIFYFGSARREEVLFSEELRQRTKETIHLALKLQLAEDIPRPLESRRATRTGLPALHPKCKDCSLEPLCLPREVLALRSQANR